MSTLTMFSTSDVYPLLFEVSGLSCLSIDLPAMVYLLVIFAVASFVLWFLVVRIRALLRASQVIHCAICDYNLNGQEHYDIHRRGYKHRKQKELLRRQLEAYE